MRNLLRVIHIIFVISACSLNTKKDSQVFRYNQETSISSLDPAFAKDQAMIWATTQLFDGLVELDTNLQVQPAIAESWEVLDSGKRYRFHLRKDVKFHENECFSNEDERLVTAHDFVYSFKRIMDPNTASPGAWIFNDKVIQFHELMEVEELPFVAIDKHTFEIRLARAFPPFLGLLSMPYCFVVPEEAINYYGKNFRANPVGTGPFQFHYWEEGVRLIYERNPAYFQKDAFGQLPHLKGVDISFIENKQTAFMEFVQGKLHFFNGLEGSFKDELLTKTGQLREKYQGRFRLKRGPYLNTEYFGFQQDTILYNPDKDPLLDRYLRKAISFAVDREKMMRYLRNSIGTPGQQGFIPKGLPGFESDKRLYFYAPDSVSKYLKLSNYKSLGSPAIVLNTNKNYIDLTVFIQGQLEQFGIHTKIEVNPGPFHRQQVSKGEFPCFRGSWLADYPDAENYLTLFYSPNWSPNGPNYTHYINPEFDAKYQAALWETNDSIRFKRYAELDDLMMEDAPVLILFYDQTLHLLQNDVQGFSSSAMNVLKLKYIRLNETP